MKVTIRCIYHKAVTPSCDIVYMDRETWNRFRFGNRKEIAWIPLDDQDKLLIAPGREPQEEIINL